MLIFKIILLLSISSIAHANSWLQNSEQQGEAAFNQENYSQAVELFDDPYKRGVALYKDGQYVAAAEAFTNVKRSKVSLDAQYNLANSYFQQKEYEKAIKTYEQVLATQSDHADARHNLKLAKNSIQKDSKPSESEDSKDKDSKGEDSKDENSEQQDSQQQDSQNSEQSENSQSQQESNEQKDSQQSSQSQDESEQSQAMSEGENDESGEMGEAANLATEMATESDMMADALLERVRENPQQLLRGQFRIDAYNSKQPLADKPW